MCLYALLLSCAELAFIRLHDVTVLAQRTLQSWSSCFLASPRCQAIAFCLLHALHVHPCRGNTAIGTSPAARSALCCVHPQSVCMGFAEHDHPQLPAILSPQACACVSASRMLSTNPGWGGMVSLFSTPYLLLLQTVAKLTDACWDKCVTGYPGRELSSREEACLENCAKRFIETTQLVIQRFAQKSGAAGGDAGF